MNNTYEKNQMISLLYRIFQAENYQWFKNGAYSIPTFEEIKETIEELEADSIKDKGAVESGRIRVRYDKETQTFDYYLNLGGY
jgi:hypothetical protein